MWSGFYKKSIEERHELVNKVANIQPLVSPIKVSVADKMIENCIGVLGLPIGLALNFTINEQPILIPMAIEEPSVIAAASSAAKTIGNIKAVFEKQKCLTEAQIFVTNVNAKDPMMIILNHRAELVARGNEFCKGMVARGGGVIDVYSRLVDEDVVVHILVDVCNAMGANCVNTVAEGLASTVEDLLQGVALAKICSNLAMERSVKAEFRQFLDKLEYKNLQGSELAERIVKLNEWAEKDPFRATTHNKGIMNGVDAVALACGQDWRAIEASVYSAQYFKAQKIQPFTEYRIEGDKLVGEISICLPVGTAGGVFSTNPAYKSAFELMGNPDAKQLSEILAAVGIAQNFAALRALASDGIQKGHMALHSRRYE